MYSKNSMLKKKSTVKSTSKSKGYVSKFTNSRKADANIQNKRFHSKKSILNKKREIKKERQSMRPENNIVTIAKEKWNILREKTLETEKRQKILVDLMNLVCGKVYALCSKHDSSRVIQCLISTGTKEHRIRLLKELDGKIVELCKLPYAHFIVIKFINYADTIEEKKIIVKNLENHIIQLAVHSIGARVIQEVFNTLSSSLVAKLRAEFYCSEKIYLSLINPDNVPRKLTSYLNMRPEKRDIIVEGVRNLIMKIAQKSLLVFPFSHGLIWEYLNECQDYSKIHDVLASVMDGFMFLLSTRNGSRAASMLVAYGTSKDRKRIMKMMKGYVATSLIHRDAYLVVLRLVSTVDDTISCQKLILTDLLLPVPTKSFNPAKIQNVIDDETMAESSVPRGITPLKQIDHREEVDAKNETEEPVTYDNMVESNEKKLALESICFHVHGCKLLLYLLSDKSTSYFNPEEINLMQPVFIPNSDGSMICTSKKDSGVRREELLAFIKEPLISLCLRMTRELMQSKFSGSRVLLETVKRFPSDELISAIVNETLRSPDQNSFPAYEHPSSHLFIKHLLNWESSLDIETLSHLIFANELVTKMEEGSVIERWIATNRGALLIKTLMDVPLVSQRVFALLRKCSIDPSIGEGQKILLEAIGKEKLKKRQKSKKF